MQKTITKNNKTSSYFILKKITHNLGYIFDYIYLMYEIYFTFFKQSLFQKNIYTNTKYKILSYLKINIAFCYKNMNKKEKIYKFIEINF